MSNGPIAAVELQPSEAQVFAAASRIYAAYLAAGRVDPDSEESTMEHCIQCAIRIALRVDKLLQSDDETVGLGMRSSAS